MYAVYPFGRNYVNDNLTNEKIVGMELGFHFFKIYCKSKLIQNDLERPFQTVGDHTVVTGTLENPNGYFSYEGLVKRIRGQD
jgi:hypothetical protein